MLSQEASSSSSSPTAPSFDGELPTLHTRLDALADRVAAGELVGLVVFDASHLEALERSHGPDLFETVVERLYSIIEASRGTTIRTDDIICRNAPGGDAILLFLSPPRTRERRLAAVDIQTLVERSRERWLDATVNSPVVSDALHDVRLGTSLIDGDADTDPRRSIYRAVREAKADVAPPGSPDRDRGGDDDRIRQLVTERQLETRFQPIIDLDDRERVGWEALTRPTPEAADHLDAPLFESLHDPEIARELDDTCRQLAVRRSPTLDDGQKLFVNSLGSAFISPADRLEAFVDQSVSRGLSPETLVLELNENVTQQQLDQMLPAIRTLRARGVGFAIDDMGTGTTNLRVLVELEPDYIKMDKSLVRGLADDLRRQALASYMVDLARRSHASLIAEGIEDADDLEIAAELGVDYAQGYHLGRPRHPDHLD